MPSVRSSRIVTACAILASRTRQAASTSRAVTGAPSQKRASDRRVTVQRSAAPCPQDRERAGRTRPWQSTRISVSYSCAKTNRSAPLYGTGACIGSTGSVSATVTVSRGVIRPVATKHVVSDGAAAGCGNSPRGAAPRQAATSRPARRTRWDEGITGAGSGGWLSNDTQRREPQPGRRLRARLAHHQGKHVPLGVAEVSQPEIVVRGPVHEVRLNDELHAPAAQRRVRRCDVRYEVVHDRRRVVEFGRLGDTEHEGRRTALEERHLRRRLEEKGHAQRVAVEADGAIEVAGANEDLADGGETELRGCRGHTWNLRVVSRKPQVASRNKARPLAHNW